MLEQLWFWLSALLIAGYVLLDGFDIGAGAIHLFVARTREERATVLKTIGPFWDGNEVWLLAAGGTLYFAFPALYASSFSGFYLPLMMVLWLLILRGCSIEFRNHINPASPLARVWIPIWDFGFFASSALLAIFFGAALGNVVRGVPIDSSQEFFLPLWTNFRPGPSPGILDWYTILIGVLVLAALAMHGALWVAYKTEGEVQARAQGLSRRLWPLLLLLTALATWTSLALQPHIWANFQAHVLAYAFPLLALIGMAGMLRGGELRAFLSSCLYLAGMLLSMAFGVFPYVLPSSTNPELGLTIYNAAPAAYGLRVGLMWWIPGVILALGYTVFVYRRFAGKVS
jgi:cytochrome bd ubiquinol oxidase subunit II